MRMARYRKDGYSMYTKVLRFVVRFGKKVSGHCDPGGEAGHCS